MSDVCVRVAVRVRPLLRKEILHNHRVCLRVVPASAQVLLGSDRLFSFDHAFGPTAGQTELYETCVQPLVGSLVEGCNATVFCYGQTGSGKTYTLGGGKLDEEGGIIDLLARDMFLLLREKKCSEDVKSTVRVSYIELYKEELRDLLELHTAHKELHIREDDRGNTVVVGATEMVVSSAEELLGALEMGNALRHTGATGMNEHSSRSHAILTLHLAQGHSNSSSSLRCSKLNLVDLAGSERAGKTGNTGVRLKESVHINTGLLALGNVIRALSDHGRNRRGINVNSLHIPYRDAKLTRLLRDSLGGSSHTLLVACISPSHHSIAESLSVLQFATKTRHIRNRPGATSCPAEVKSCPAKWEPGDTHLEELEHEIQTLKELLKERERELDMERGTAGRTVTGEGIFEQSSQICDSEQDKEVNRGEEPSQCCLLLQEAAALFAEVCGPASSHTFKQQVQDWQERLKSVCYSHQMIDPNCSGKKDQSQLMDDSVGSEDEDQPYNVSISELKQELKKCQEALTIKTQLLDQIDVEKRRMQKEVETLLKEREAHLHTLDEGKERLRIQTEQLVDQTILINHLRNNVMILRGTISGGKVETGASGDSDKRSHSVPLMRHSFAHRASRKIKSSPPVYSLERVMAAFKMRSHLLLAELEEKDEVYCPFVKSQCNERPREEEDDDFIERIGFRRSLNLTWTSRQKKPSLQEETSNKNPVQQSQKGTKDHHTNSCHLRNAKLRASVTQRKIQLLSTNMRMKEELIKDLDKTDKETRVLGKHGDNNSKSRETGVLARLSMQSQQCRAEVHRSLQNMSLQRAQLQRSLRQGGETSNTSGFDHDGEDSAEDLTMSRGKRQQWSKEKAQEKCWLEDAEERVLQRRAELEELEEELQRRKEVLQEREACLQQKNKLEIKKLRSSQALGQDLLRVSVQLQSVKEQLQRHSSERQSAGVTKEELEKERDTLKKKRDALDAQLKDNRVLTEEEEHSLLQLEEAIEALDAALEFKNHSIQDKRKRLSIPDSPSCQSQNTEDGDLDNVMRKLKELQPPEASELLVRYFNKVVFLREAERHLRLRCEELELQAGEHEAVLREMKAAMQRVALDADRRLTQLQRDHQSNIQLLLQKLQEGSSGDTQQAVKEKIQNLEKELFFYKSTSRQLKKKLKEVLGDGNLPAVQPLNAVKHTHNKQEHISADKPHLQAEKVQTKTCIAPTYTKIHPEQKGKNKHDDALKESHHSLCRSESFELQTQSHTQMSICNQIHTLQQSHEKNEKGARGGEGFGVTSVRLCRRELRQISPAELQVCNSATGRHQSVIDASMESIVEDSIEVLRNTDN